MPTILCVSSTHKRLAYCFQNSTEKDHFVMMMGCVSIMKLTQLRKGSRTF